MSNTIKGLLIDPTNRTISEVEIDSDDDGSYLAAMYEVMGCDCVDVGRGGLQFLPSGPIDDVWFDDEGMYSDCEDCFIIPGFVPLIGKGLILCYDENGNSTSYSLTPEDVAELRSVVRWCKRQR